MFWLDELLAQGSVPRSSGTGPEWQPGVDIFELNDSFLLCFAVPGVRQEDVEVLTTGDLVVVRGIRTLEVPRDATPRQLELTRGRFERRVRLPTTVPEEGVRTQMAQGLLLVHVPAPRHRVRIRVRPG